MTIFDKRINNCNANTIFLFYIEIKYCISMKKHKQNQDKNKTTT